MKTYLITKYRHGFKGETFQCLYEVDPEMCVDISVSKDHISKRCRILRVLVGDSRIEHAKRKDFFGAEFYMWKLKKSNIFQDGYYQNEPGFGLLEMEDDETALLWFRLR